MQPVQSSHSTSNSFMQATYCIHICATNTTRPILMCHKRFNNSPSFFLSIILPDTMIISPYVNVHTYRLYCSFWRGLRSPTCFLLRCKHLDTNTVSRRAEYVYEKHTPPVHINLVIFWPVSKSCPLRT